MNFKIFRTFALAVSLAATGLAAQTTAVASGSTPAIDNTWWKHAVIYEIYPRSFQDSNGDGIGDLNGITQRLDYLQTLGVDAIWISPMYPSPQVDFGYDISDYENVDPQYGTLKDFDRLVEEAGKRNIRVILDMVLNHTSDKHKWFIESASSRKNPKRDWYVWNDVNPGVNGKPVPPNNWESLFGGSAWEYMPQTRSFYYHKFYKQQPDLNWSNPAVEKAMFGTMQFWLDREVAGYRLDAIPTLFEDPQLRDPRHRLGELVAAIAGLKPERHAAGDPKRRDRHHHAEPFRESRRHVGDQRGADQRQQPDDRQRHDAALMSSSTAATTAPPTKTST